MGRQPSRSAHSGSWLYTVSTSVGHRILLHGYMQSNQPSQPRQPRILPSRIDTPRCSRWSRTSVWRKVSSCPLATHSANEHMNTPQSVPLFCSDSSYQTHLQQPQGPGSRPEPDLRTRFGEDCDQRSPGGDECAKQPYIPRRQPIKPRSATRQHRPSTWPRPMAANVEDAIISSRKIVINHHSTAARPTRCEQTAWLVSMQRTGREGPVWRA